MKDDTAPTALTHLLLAAVLLTRLTLPRLSDRAFPESPRAVWAYPVIGAILALGTGGLGLLLLRAGLPEAAAAGIVLGLIFAATGGMHEDGLADTADGFWGGHTPARRLEIMRDSRIGSFGVLALILSTGLRWIALATLLPLGLTPLILAAVLSRAAMPVLMHLLPQARKDGLAQSIGRPGAAPVGLGLLLSFCLTAALAGAEALLPIGMTALCLFVVGTLAMRKIGGLTGDVLGALQVTAETAILLCFCALYA